MNATMDLVNLDEKLAGLDKRFAAVDERLAEDLRRLDNLESMIDALKAEWKRQDMRRALWRK
jgi:chromosome segregation ATPase